MGQVCCAPATAPEGSGGAGTLARRLGNLTVSPKLLKNAFPRSPALSGQLPRGGFGGCLEGSGAFIILIFDIPERFSKQDSAAFYFNDYVGIILSILLRCSLVDLYCIVVVNHHATGGASPSPLRTVGGRPPAQRATDAPFRALRPC